MAPATPAPDVWIDEGPVRGAATAAVARGATAGPRARSAPRLPEHVVGELVAAAGARRAPRLAERLDAARRAFERERYLDARAILAPLAREAPGAGAVRELLGLTLYRLERWRQAAAELEAYRALTGSVDQNPVLADAYRALRRYTEVEALWQELRAASPSAELVAEGRIVAAGAQADRGELPAAIALLEAGDRRVKRVRPHHLRLWYALGDLYDRAGDVPRARSLFGRVAAQDADFADVGPRLAALGRPEKM